MMLLLTAVGGVIACATVVQTVGRRRQQRRYSALPTWRQYRQQAAAMDTEGRARCVYCGSGILAAYYLDARCCEHVCSLCGGRLYRTGFEG